MPALEIRMNPVWRNQKGDEKNSLIDLRVGKSQEKRKSWPDLDLMVMTRKMD